MRILLDTCDFLWFICDPFDRMLVCQALDAGMSLASADPVMRKYPVTLL